MTIDISKIKPGDKLTIEAEFVRIGVLGDPVVRVRTPGSGGQDGAILADDIVSHTPKAFQPGDRVKSRFDGAEYEIVAGPRQRKDGAIEVALWSDELGFFDSSLSNLERVK